MLDPALLYVERALESLAGAASEVANGRYNNAANRAYYARFQAAVAGLSWAGVTPRSASREWSHAFVPAQFDGELINRRKLYPPELRGTLSLNQILRTKADYHEAAGQSHRSESSATPDAGVRRGHPDSGRRFAMIDQAATTNEEMQAAVDELAALIRQHHPQAQFRLSRDPAGSEAIHLVVTVDVDDTDQVVDLVLDRMMQLQIDQDLPLFVIPIRTPERESALREAERSNGAVRAVTTG